MKPIGTSVLLGILLALLVIYLLKPLNTGAVVLIAILSVGVTGSFVNGASWLIKKRSRK